MSALDTIKTLALSLIQEEADHFLVDIQEIKKNTFAIFYDSDTGITLDILARYNRSLRSQIEEINLFPKGDFALEVSSPSLDKPLILHRQYPKNIGRDIRVITQDNTELQGTLTQVNDEQITLIWHTKLPKKQTLTHEKIIPFTDIKKTFIVIKF